ncbi:MAG: GDSL-type esterase/lipase family protein, partial [Pirellulaceae bacterium]
SASAQINELQLEERFGTSAEAWNGDINRFEEETVRNPATKDDILFIGSSSIRLWDTIEQDLVGYHPVRRGFGGSRYSDVAIFLPRILNGHTPKAVVFFVANDISGSPNRDISPNDVADIANWIAVKTHAMLPDTPIFFIETTPTNSRWNQWDEIKQANDLIRDMTEQYHDCHFISTRGFFLNGESKPESAFFQSDQLHLNNQGYQLWGQIIGLNLNAHLGSSNSSVDKTDE